MVHLAKNERTSLTKKFPKGVKEMFENYQKSQAPSGLRWTVPLGALVVAMLIGSTIVVPKLFPAQVRQVKQAAAPIFFPAVVDQAPPEAPKVHKLPTGPQKSTVRVERYHDPFEAPRVVPTEILTDVPEVFVPPNSRVGDLPTVSACPPGATCVFGNEPVSPPPPPPPVVKPEPPKAVAKPERIVVSSGVQGAKLVFQPKPVYPDLARKARIQGMVRLTAIISRDGSIQNLTLVSGHPLLVQGAMDSVRRWRSRSGAVVAG
jgi:protein TonB